MIVFPFANPITLRMFQSFSNYCGQPISGWLMMEKLDGFRMAWNGTDFFLHGVGILNVPVEWKAGMPSCALDGDLFAGVGRSGLIPMRISNGYRGLCYKVFDAPSTSLPFRKRLAILKSLSLPSHCELVPYIRCRDTRHLVEFADTVVDAGGEGAVVYNPRAAWQEGRTDNAHRWLPQGPRFEWSVMREKIRKMSLSNLQ